MEETIKKLADNLQWFKDHPKPEVKKLSLINCIELAQELPEDEATKELITNLKGMKTVGYSKILWLRCRELKCRLMKAAKPELYP